MQGWIFQGNPRYFDIDQYVMQRREKWLWNIKQTLSTGISMGDIVYIWRSDGGHAGSGGIIAKAEVTGVPSFQVDDSNLWTDESQREPVLRIPLHILEARTDGAIIKRTWLAQDDHFSNLRILKLPNMTNYLLSDDHFALLTELWDGIKVIDMESLDADSFSEGRLTYIRHVQRERSTKLVEQAKEYYKRRDGELHCQICNFSFEKMYGNWGIDFIEMHHCIPLSRYEEQSETRISDLIPVCANCHRMLHRRRPWLHIDDLHDLVNY